MKRGGFDSKDYPVGVQYFTLAFVGTGASAPAVASNGLVAPLFPVKANAASTVAAEAPARSGVGAYTVQYGADFTVFKILTADGPIMGTTGLWFQVTAISESTRTLTVKVFNAGGAATDLGTSDLMLINVRAVDSNTVK